MGTFSALASMGTNTIIAYASVRLTAFNRLIYFICIGGFLGNSVRLMVLNTSIHRR